MVAALIVQPKLVASTNVELAALLSVAEYMWSAIPQLVDTVLMGKI